MYKYTRTHVAPTFRPACLEKKSMKFENGILTIDIRKKKAVDNSDFGDTCLGIQFAQQTRNRVYFSIA